MMKRITKLALCASLALAAVGLTAGGGSLLARADGTVTYNYSKSGVTVTCGGVTETVITDPYTNVDTAASGQLTGNRWSKNSVSSAQGVMYTAAWWKTTTERTGAFDEYVVEPDGKQFKIAAVSDAQNPAGSLYIPVGGFVLSLPQGKNFGKTGDQVTVGGNKDLVIPTMAVESEDGDRVAIDALNAVRTKPMVVYYDYQSGDKTGTNAYGTELVATYDEESNAFVVQKFRAFGEGDSSGIAIPENSFVLSAYGEGFRGILVEDARFSLGDKLSLAGFDFVRFGNTVSYSYNYIDPTLETNPQGWDPATNGEFPAFRGENQLNVYRDGWSYKGSSGTGANVYGFEVAVSGEGVVVERAVNVSAIPENGYVLSGHGTGRDFLRSSVPLGATVTLNEENKTFSVTTTLNSFYTNVKMTLDAAVENAERRISQLYDVNTELLDRLLEEAEGSLKELLEVKENIEKNEKDWTGAQRTRELMNFNRMQLSVSAIANSITAATIESKPVAARSVWHRPTEKSLQEVRASLQTYKDCGIDLVFVEAFYGGMALFRSEIAPYHSDFGSASYGSYPDFLSAFTAVAHELGIEVHAWVENFYVGINENAGTIAQHPEWVMYNDDGSILQRNEGGPYIFIDPASSEVRDYLISLYNEMLDKVPYIDGLNLDYIRYPVSNRGQDTGYTLAAMKGFAESIGSPIADTGYSAVLKTFKRLFNSDFNLQADENYEKWVEYRTQIVSDFVKRVKDEVKGTHEGLVLSTAVFPSLTDSVDNKKQDWQRWFKNGWIDIATPMAYYTDSSDVLLHVKDMILMAGGNCYYYAGLASSYSGLPAYENANQIDAAYLAGSNGFVIFCSTQILGHEDVQSVLSAGVGSAKAVLPHASVSEVLGGYFDRIEDRATRLYIPAGGMTEKDLAALKTRFGEILAMDMDDAEGVAAVLKAVRELSEDYGDYAAGFSARRLSETLSELVSLLDTKLSRTMIDSGEWDPETQPVRPSVGGESEQPPEKEPEGGGTEQKPEPSTSDGCGSVTAAGAAILVLGAALVLCKRKK